jgi:hypothetical protein
LKNGGKINAASLVQFRASLRKLVRTRPLADLFAQLVAGPTPLNRSSFDINSTRSQKLAARTGAALTDRPHRTSTFGGSVFFAVFQKIDFNPGEGSSAGVLRVSGPARAIALARSGDWREQVEAWAERIDLAPDLGRDIGSRSWWRGLFTCLLLCALTISLSPGFRAIPGPVPGSVGERHYDQYRAQMVNALALGADSGAHMGPTDAVSPLAETPERPRIELCRAQVSAMSTRRMRSSLFRKPFPPAPSPQARACAWFWAAVRTGMYPAPSTSSRCARSWSWDSSSIA